MPSFHPSFLFFLPPFYKTQQCSEFTPTFGIRNHSWWCSRIEFKSAAYKKSVLHAVLLLQPKKSKGQVKDSLTAMQVPFGWNNSFFPFHAFLVSCGLELDQRDHGHVFGVWVSFTAAFERPGAWHPDIEARWKGIWVWAILSVVWHPLEGLVLEINDLSSKFLFSGLSPCPLLPLPVVWGSDWLIISGTSASRDKYGIGPFWNQSNQTLALTIQVCPDKYIIPCPGEWVQASV